MEQNNESDYVRGWREGIQTTCVMLISERAKAEQEAKRLRDMGYPCLARDLEGKAAMASELEQRLRARQKERP